MTIKENGVLKGYCYFDWKDTGFPRGAACNYDCPNGNDMTIRYDGSGDIIVFNNKNASKENPNGVYISNGDIITWADWKDCEERDFSPFWSGGLVVIPGVSSHPKLVWGPYNNSINLYYIIERKIGSGSWVEIDQTSNLTYTDEELTITPDYGAYVKYRVTAAIYEETISTTNEFTVVVYNINKISSNNSNNELSYALLENYPNPFNPSTTVYFSIPKKEKVILKVFDMLGNEIETLADGEYEGGSYELNFNAGNLSSGIYFYTIITNDFVKTNKMILAK